MDIVTNTVFGNPNLPRVQYPGFADHFNAADGTLDYTEDGKTWELVKSAGSGAPLWVRASGAAKLQTPSPSAHALVDGLSADGVLTQTIRSVGSTRAGLLIFRYVDINNYYYITQNNGSSHYRCYKYKAGVNSSTIFNSSTTSTNGDVLEVTLSGSSISITCNGSSLGSATDSDFATATKHGMNQNSTDYTETIESLVFVAA